LIKPGASSVHTSLTVTPAMSVVAEFRGDTLHLLTKGKVFFLEFLPQRKDLFLQFFDGLLVRLRPQVKSFEFLSFGEETDAKLLGCLPVFKAKLLELFILLGRQRARHGSTPVASTVEATHVTSRSGTRRYVSTTGAGLLCPDECPESYPESYCQSNHYCLFHLLPPCKIFCLTYFNSNSHASGGGLCKFFNLLNLLVIFVGVDFARYEK
jgi:hypothetical protein